MPSQSIVRTHLSLEYWGPGAGRRPWPASV